VIGDLLLAMEGAEKGSRRARAKRDKKDKKIEES